MRAFFDLNDTAPDAGETVPRTGADMASLSSAWRRTERHEEEPEGLGELVE